MNRTNITITISKDTLNKLKKLKESKYINVSRVLNDMLDKYLDSEYNEQH